MLISNKAVAILLSVVLSVVAACLILYFIAWSFKHPPIVTESEDSYVDITYSEESFLLDTSEESFIESSEESEDTPPLEPISLMYELLDFNDIKKFEEELAYCEERLSSVKAALESISTLGYKDTNELVIVLQEDYKNYSSYIDYYKEKINELKELKFKEQLAEYPAATYIWYYMKEQGFSDIVCAGIMGNIMQEVGGRTLDINYLHSNDYYGICCWKKEYHPEVVDKGLEGQCAYLVETLVSCMNNSGYLYEEGYTYEDFLAAETIEEAANAFMVVYERPGHRESPKRNENGRRAYEYFVGPIESN